MMVEVGGASSTYLAGDFTNGLNEFQGELSDRGENLPDREARDHASLAMGDTVLALAGGSFFELLVHFVADAASLARKQAEEIAAKIRTEQGPAEQASASYADRQVVAVVAYLMRLGTDLDKPAPAPAVGGTGIATVAEPATTQGGGQ